MRLLSDLHVRDVGGRVLVKPMLPIGTAYSRLAIASVEALHRLEILTTDIGFAESQGDQEEGEIPGQYPCDDPDRLAMQEDALPRPVALNDFTFDPARPLGHVIDVSAVNETSISAN